MGCGGSKAGANKVAPVEPSAGASKRQEQSEAVVVGEGSSKPASEPKADDPNQTPAKSSKDAKGKGEAPADPTPSKGKASAKKEPPAVTTAPITAPDPNLPPLSVPDEMEHACLHRYEIAPERLAEYDELVMRKFGREVYVWIGIMSIDNATDVRQLALIMNTRHSLINIIDQCQGHVVKANNVRIFATFENANNAIKATLLSMMTVGEHNIRNEASTRDQINFRVGVDYSRCVLLKADVYGDAVNMASKLGEDTAQPGQALISTAVRSAIVEPVPLTYYHHEAVIGGVPTSYHRLGWEAVSLQDAEALTVVDARLPRRRVEQSEVTQACIDFLRNTEALDSDVVPGMESVPRTVLVSDMSGFTRITKAKGIIHFLSMIMKMREISRPILESNGAEYVFWEGDNFIAVFTSAVKAFGGAQGVLAAFADHNQGRDDLLQLKVGLGMNSGKVLMIPAEEEISGDTLDFAYHLGEEESHANEVLASDTSHAALKKAGLTDTFLFAPKRTKFEDQERRFHTHAVRAEKDRITSPTKAPGRQSSAFEIKA